jgi:hypothetical protein
MYRTTLKPATATKNRMRFAVADKGPTKSEKGSSTFYQSNQEIHCPGSTHYCCIAGSGRFVALQKHEYTLGRQQGGEKIPFWRSRKRHTSGRLPDLPRRNSRSVCGFLHHGFPMHTQRLPGRPFTGYLSGDAWSVNQWDMIDHFRFYIKFTHECSLVTGFQSLESGYDIQKFLRN